MAVAVETSLGPNQTAARRGGRLTMKTCAVPHSVCATISSGKRDGETAQHFSQAPKALMAHPTMLLTRRPRLSRMYMPGKEDGMHCKGSNMSSEDEEEERKRKERQIISETRMASEDE